MLAEMSSAQLAEWMAYEKLEPWGESRADLRAGIIASTFANIFRNKEKQRKPYNITDFMPSFEPEDEQDQVAKLLAKAKSVFRRFSR